MQFNDDVVGGVTLVRPAIQSPDYLPGTSGWTINVNGSAEFNNVVIRGGTTVSGTALYYNGTPGPGTLVASISAADGTDEFGNGYRQGICTYSLTALNTGTYAMLTQGGLYVGQVNNSGPGPDFSTAGSYYSNIGAAIGQTYARLMSPQNVTNGDTAPADVYMVAGGNLQVTGTSRVPHLIIGNDTNASDVDTWISGSVIKTNGWNIPETWHTPTFTSNWATTGTLNTNATFRGLQYRLMAENDVWLLGGAVASSGPNATITTLPAGYRPSTGQRQLVPCWIYTSGAANPVAAFAQITESGAVAVNSTLAGVAVAAGTQVFFNGRYTLGQVA